MFRHIKLTFVVIGVMVTLCLMYKQQVALKFTSMGASRVCLAELQSADAWVKPTLPDHLQNVAQDNSELADRICQDWLIPPSSKPRNLDKPNDVHYAQKGQSQLVDKLLGGRKNGFYVECGGYNGEFLSNSLFFEKSRNWSGVLIEGGDELFHAALSKNRHAYLVNACLSPEKKPSQLEFLALQIGMGGIVEEMSEHHRKRIGLEKYRKDIKTIQCLPLYSILQAIGVSHIDYFSLDVEGGEVDILLTLPLDKVTVDVFSIEYVVGGIDGRTPASQQKLKRITDYLVGEHGYEVIKISSTEDVILKKVQST